MIRCSIGDEMSGGWWDAQRDNMSGRWWDAWWVMRCLIGDEMPIVHGSWWDVQKDDLLSG